MLFDEILQSIRRHVADLGFELVDLIRGGHRTRPVLRVRIDRPDGGPGRGVTADDCAVVSRTLERWLDAAELVGPRYVLEVSSPGLDRPIRWPEHWRRFVGRRVRLRAAGVPGRAEAEIVSLPDADHVRLRLIGGDDVLLALADIREATLVVDWDGLRQR